MARVHTHPFEIDPNTLEAAHKAIGKALANWQHVETALYMLVHCLLGTSHANSSIVFFHIKSAENKVQLVDRLCYEHLSQRAYASTWKNIRTDLANLIDLRNGIAHFELTGIDLARMKEPRPTQFPVAISSHHLDVAAHRNGTARGLYLEPLEAVAAEFIAMTNRIAQFVVDHVPHWRHHVARLPHSLQQALGIDRKMGSSAKPERPPRS
jgi:hypothetical protein